MELMQGALEAFNAGDYESALATVAPDVEGHIGDWVIDGGVLHSRDEALQFFRRNAESGDWTVVATGAEVVVPGVVLVTQRGHSTGGTTRIQGEFEFFVVYELGPDGVKRIREFPTYDGALAAATD